MTTNLVAELEKRRQSQIALTKQQLKEYEKLLPAQAAFLETKYNAADTKTVWVPVDVKKTTAVKKGTLAKQADGSILSSGVKAVANFEIAAKTSLEKITGVMLEV